MKKFIQKQLFTGKLVLGNFLKGTHNPSKMRPLDVDKNDTGCLLGFYKESPSIFTRSFNNALKKDKDFIPITSNTNQNISCSNSDVITILIELTNLKKVRKPENHPSLSVKFYKVFLSFSELLPVLVPACISPLLFFSRNCTQQEHVYLIPNLLLYHNQM